MNRPRIEPELMERAALLAAIIIVTTIILLDVGPLWALTFHVTALTGQLLLSARMTRMEQRRIEKTKRGRRGDRCPR